MIPNLKNIFRKGRSDTNHRATVSLTTKATDSVWCIPPVAVKPPACTRRALCQACNDRSSLPIFEHKFLENAKAATRLLHIEPRRGKEPLYGVVVEHGLKDEEYEALSYRWDNFDEEEDLDRVAHIHINGRLFRISESVEKALFLFRHADRDRLLWIDQICIDQRKKDEKKWHGDERERRTIWRRWS